MQSKFTKPPVIKILQWIHVSTLIIGVGVIFLLHLYPENILDFLRLPAFLKDINPFLGFGWPASLHVYQVILVFFLVVSLIDALGLLFYESRPWRIFSDLSSFLGFLIIWPASVFFIFTLVSTEGLKPQSIHTALVYFGFTFFIFILDLVTWFVDEQAIFVRKLVKIPMFRK